MPSGGGGTTTTTSNATTVNVTTNVSGPPITVSVGADLFKPLQDTFGPVAESVQASLVQIRQASDELINRQATVERKAAADQNLIKLALVGLAVLAALQIRRRT